MKDGLTVGISGASGAVYGVRLVEVLLKKGLHINLIISRWGLEIIKEECDINLTKDYPHSVKKFFGNKNNLEVYSDDDLGGEISSGSSMNKRMVIIPCSMGTLGRIASGISSTLIERSADVVLKEKGTLIVVPRETPINIIHLENMLRLARAGAVILPAMPAFYHKPRGIDDMVNFVVGKVMDILGIEHQLFRRWRSCKTSER